MMRLKKWNYQSVLNILMTMAIILLAFPVLTLASARGVPMAIEFNAESQYLSFATTETATDNLSKISIISWLKVVTHPANGKIFSIAKKASALAYKWEFAYGEHAGDGSVKALTFGINYGVGNVGTWIGVNNPLTVGQVYMVAVTYDSTVSTNDPIFYVGTSAQSLIININPGSVGSVDDSGMAFSIASDAAAGTYYNGVFQVLDERIYNYIVTPDDIANIYNSRCMGVHPVAGLPVFAPMMYGASGLQAFDGATLAAGNKIVDPYSGAYGTPAGNPIGRAETYLIACP